MFVEMGKAYQEETQLGNRLWNVWNNQWKTLKKKKMKKNKKEWYTFKKLNYIFI